MLTFLSQCENSRIRFYYINRHDLIRRVNKVLLMYFPVFAYSTQLPHSTRLPQGRGNIPTFFLLHTTHLQYYYRNTHVYIYIYIITVFTKRDYHRVEETYPHSFCYTHNTFIVLLQKHSRLYLYIYIITLFTKRDYHRVEETYPHSFCYTHNTFIVLLQKHTRLQLYLYYNVIYKKRLPQGRGNIPTLFLLHTQHIYSIIIETHVYIYISIL